MCLCVKVVATSRWDGLVIGFLSPTPKFYSPTDAEIRQTHRTQTKRPTLQLSRDKSAHTAAGDGTSALNPTRAT